ncbi:hypothetical protein GDO81_010756 [Engystomops pustulosus]|uniref:Uncharacterized protein n=1 Tax=Engystomops pustulosus TaxID=76066 RepID=A0AAV7C3E2_ENGPU|nr:hypothetical protein GDO81_010756 [Engystomops pustulosus]
MNLNSLLPEASYRMAPTPLHPVVTYQVIILVCGSSMQYVTPMLTSCVTKRYFYMSSSALQPPLAPLMLPHLAIVGNAQVKRLNSPGAALLTIEVHV